MFNFRSLLTPAPQFENIEETLIIAFKKVNTKYLLVWRPKNCTFFNILLDYCGTDAGISFVATFQSVS